MRALAIAALVLAACVSPHDYQFVVEDAPIDSPESVIDAADGAVIDAPDGAIFDAPDGAIVDAPDGAIIDAPIIDAPIIDAPIIDALIDAAPVVPLTVTLTGAGAANGVVTSLPAGIFCGADCSESYTVGTAVTLVASVTGTSVFAGWSGGGCTGTGTCVVTLGAATAITATFNVATSPTLTVTRTGAGNGTITSSPAGINCGSDCTEAYPLNQVVTLTATPAAGSNFTGWSGGGCTGTGTCNVTMSGNLTVMASFSLQSFNVTVTRAGTGVGTVTSSPGGINCGSTCTAPFGFGTVVTLTATPSVGSTFAGWSGAGCTGTGTCVFTVNSGTAITATFTLNQYLLTVAKAGAGAGTVTSTPSGINCGGACTATYNHGAVIALSAAASAGSTFTGWSGAGCTGTGACNVTLTAATTVTATFALQPFTVTVIRTGTGTGTVTSSPSGINCGTACSASFAAGSMVTLTAVPDMGSTFTGWSGACMGLGTCVVSAAATATATFAVQMFALSITKTGNGNGNVSSAPAGIDCGSTCNASFAYGAVVTLTANDNTGSNFSSWTGACAGASTTCMVTMTAARSVNAVFVLESHSLTVTRAGSGGGTVTSSPSGINCGGSCVANYNDGTQVTLTAAPDGTSMFTGWSGACGGTGSCVLNMTANRSVTATFVRMFTVDVGRSGGAGNVSSSPAPTTGTSPCTLTSCLWTFPAGTSVTFTASPFARFEGWDDPACDFDNPCVLTIDADRSLRAFFCPIAGC